MKRNILFIITTVLLMACGGVKKTQKALNVGDYSNAIYSSISILAKNKGKKSNQPYILMLEEAYKKNTDRELSQIEFLQNDENPAHYEEIYNGYVNLNKIQERIKPLLPLYIEEENRKAEFIFKDYQNEILDSKDDLAEFLYENASQLLQEARSKQDFRKAYNDFSYLEEINPGFEDTSQKIEEAYEKGQEFVHVDLVNETEVIIPARLEEELLNFDTYGLDQMWTKYHSNPQPNIAYDYHMQLSLRNINISPEKVSEKQLIKERQVKDGFTYATDRQGTILKDSLGHKVKVDKFKTVKCNFYQFTQFKAAEVNGLVQFTDLHTKQQLRSYPISSEFVFEHVYADIDGDQRALDDNLTQLLKLEAVPFPSNEQMVYDAGEDIKNRLKSILRRHRFN